MLYCNIDGTLSSFWKDRVIDLKTANKLRNHRVSTDITTKYTFKGYN